MATTETANAQTFWIGDTGDWNDGANWSLGVPSSSSGTAFDAAIANGGSAQLFASGASVRRLRVGRSEGAGQLVIDGGGLTVTDNFHLNEGSAGVASVIVQGGSTVTAPTTVVGYSSNFDTSFQISGAGTVYNATTLFDVGRLGAGAASLTVDNGAVLASATSTLASVSGAAGSATVTDGGSRWSSTGAFTVGSGVAGVLNITNQGTVHVGTTLTIGSTSNVNLNGGTLRFNTLSGILRLNYTAGTIQLAGNRDIILDGGLFDLYGASRIIPSGKGLTVEGTTTIKQDKTLTVSGGTFTSQGLLTVGLSGAAGGSLTVSNGGTAAANANATIDNFGFATVSGAGSSWTIGGNLNLATASRGDLFILNQGSLYIGGALLMGSNGQFTLNGGTIRFNGYNRIPPTALFNYSAGTVQLAGNRTLGSDAATVDFFGASPTIPTGKALVVEGTATLTATAPLILSGGTLSADTVLMTPGSRITNTLTTQVSGAMLALAGSVIDATAADLTLGDSAKVNGFYGNGTIQVGQRNVTLADANDAVLDSATLVALGANGNPGALAAVNGLTLNFGGNIVGYGTIDTPNDPAKPFINNGNLTGNSLEQPITLNGYVKGVGTLDNVTLGGTYAPGFSPATVYAGSVAYAGTLEIELAGTGSGQFDSIHHAETAALGGTLQVSLLGGFTPVPGNSFDILDWGTLSGTFSSIVLPALTGGKTWNTSLLYSSGVISVSASFVPGDFDSDGDVDGADFVAWQTNFPKATGATLAQGDADSDGDVDGADFVAWQTHFPFTPGPGAAPVPEPAALILALAAVATMGCWRRRAA